MTHGAPSPKTQGHHTPYKPALKEARGRRFDRDLSGLKLGYGVRSERGVGRWIGNGKTRTQVLVSEHHTSSAREERWESRRSERSIMSEFAAPEAKAETPGEVRLLENAAA